MAFPPISSLIPHAGPSCLLEAVTHSDRERTDCSARLDAAHPYLRGGRVHTLLAIELFAQCAAVHRALWAQTGEDSDLGGRLAGANVRLHAPRLLPPLQLSVCVTPTATLGHLHSFSGRLFLDGAGEVLLAEGDVSVSIQGSMSKTNDLATEATVR